MPDCRIGKEIKGPNLWFGLLLLPYIKLIMRFFASFPRSIYRVYPYINALFEAW